LSSLHVHLPDLSIPLVIAFGLAGHLPDVKGGFHLSFPSFKFGAKGEIEDSDSDSDDEKKKRGGFDLGIKAPKFGFGFGKDKSIDIDLEKPSTPDVPKAKVLFIPPLLVSPSLFYFVFLSC
jgi:hypothetical protein